MAHFLIITMKFISMSHGCAQVVGSQSDPLIALIIQIIMARKQRKSKSKTAVEVSDEPVVASPAPMPVEPEKKGKRGAKNGASATNGFG